MAKQVKKLVEGDPGYVAGTDIFEVTEDIQVQTSTKARRQVMTLDRVNSTIAKMQEKKNAMIADYDAIIAEYEQLKTTMEGS